MNIRIAGDPRVVIAILDTTVNVEHPDLRHANLKTVDTRLFHADNWREPFEHGTAIARLLFSTQTVGHRGISSNCSGIVIPILRGNGLSSRASATQYELARGIEAALKYGAHIINISAGITRPNPPFNPHLLTAIEHATSLNRLIIAAVGNGGCECKTLPASHPEVLAVGALELDGQPSPKNNYGKWYENHLVFAPGHFSDADVEITRYVGGSSHATAIVSSIAGLLLSLQVQQGQTLNPRMVKQRILRGELLDGNDATEIGLLPGTVAVDKALSPIHFRSTSFSNDTADLDLVMNATASNGKSYAADVPTGEPPASPITPDESASSSVTEHVSTNQLEACVFRLCHPHQNGALPFWGPFVPLAEIVAQNYKKLSLRLFGTTTIQRSDNSTYEVEDFRYKIKGDQLGILAVPVSDTHEVNINGEKFANFEVLDRLLKYKMQLSDGDPVYALMSYIRPREHTIELSRLLDTYKVQYGIPHLGSYLGQGNCSHALERVYRTQWLKKGRFYSFNVVRYPANIHYVTLMGVSHAILNRNLHIVDTILSNNYLFTAVPTRLNCRIVDINTTLQFYRDWLLDCDYLQDPSWSLNCSELRACVINVAINLPHNLQSFQQIFGTEGEDIWHQFKLRYQEITQEEFRAELETDFPPLWQLERYDPEDIQPLSFREYNQYLTAKVDNYLPEYHGRVPLEPGVCMAWKPESLIDLLSILINQYCNFLQTGSVTTVLFLHSLKKYIQQVIPVSEEQWTYFVQKFSQAILFAEAKFRVFEDGSWYTNTQASLIAGFSNVTDIEQADIAKVVNTYLEPCQTNYDALRQQRWEKGAVFHDLAEQCSHLKHEAEQVVVHRNAPIGYFTTPGVIHQIVQSNYTSNRHVTFHTVCTIMDNSEISLFSS